MSDLAQVLFLAAPVVAAVTYYFVQAILKTRRKKTELTSRQRSEIYQDMDWWDREFRKLNGEPDPVSELESALANMSKAIQSTMLNLYVPTTAQLSEGEFVVSKRPNVDAVMKEVY